MQLIYRGLAYTPETCDVESSSSEVTSQYRGATFKLGISRTTIPQAMVTLRYRGIAYLHER